MRHALAALLAFSTAAAATAEIIIDGRFEDWATTPETLIDPPNDQSGPFDITSVWVRSDQDRVLVNLDVGTASANLQSGFYPASQSLRVALAFNDADSTTINIDTLPHLYSVTAGGSTTAPDSADTGFRLLPTYASERYEFSVPRPGADETTVAISFSGSDNAETAPVVLSSDASPPPAATLSRPDDAVFRVAAINVRGFDGGVDAFERQITAADADIYCICEASGPSASQLAQFFEDNLPTDPDREWTAVKSGDTHVVSRFPTSRVPFVLLDDPPFLLNFPDIAAVVDLSAAGGPLAIVNSIHPTCCGFAGDVRDQGRIEDMTEAADAVDAIRAGALDVEIPGLSDAALIVAGDWNLVGSRGPLDIAENRMRLEAPPFPDLGTGAAAATWRETDNRDFPGQFFPGRLDLIAHDAARLRMINGFVLDTQTLTPAALASAGLQPTDSQLSDHLLIVADYALVISTADLTGDGVVGVGDLGALLAAWGTPAADLTGDNTTGPADLGVLLAAWD